ncbi:helix-turn-helix domain-containing protein [Stenotrophomonas maltophilia]|uniref:helix-turn-helix domain-containing protein n=1 Tax=Stenotrophomonas TaxID=40323 RepID=UPI000586E136|nr:helix-turn-helix domain-containing protein [Stenotrophomonas sp. SKA14]
MSTIIMSQCWPLQGLSVTQKAVLISLADQANDEGVCWPAIATIGKRCCMSARAVRTAMDHLEVVGLLTRERRFNSSNVYAVTPDKFNADAAAAKGKRKTAKGGDARGAGDAPRAGGAPDAPPGAPHAVGDAPGAGLEVRPVPPNRHITPIEPSDEPPVPALVAPPTEEELEAQMQEACKATWTAYRTAYRLRHGVDPVRNAKVNTNVRGLVKRLGREEAPQVARWFLSVNEQYAAKRMHDLGVLLAGAEAYRTQWATGRQMTQASAHQQDQTQSNANAAYEAKAKLRKLRGATNAH